MFDKKDKKLVMSDMIESDLPNTLKNKEYVLLCLLLRLTQRIASVFYIQTVYGQLDLTQLHACNLVMTNNGHRVIEGVREKENQRAIAFLQEFGGVLTTKPTPNKRISNAVVTLETQQLEPMLKKLALLNDVPSPVLGSTIRAMW